MSAFKTNCMLRAAVVDVASEVVLTSEGYSSGVDLATLSTYREFGNGFFIGRHYILVPSSLILVPPTVLANNNRWPFVSSSVVAPGVAGVGRVPEEVVQFSRILVTVHNWNGQAYPSSSSSNGHSLALQAKVVFVDGAGGYGLLKLDECSPWNGCIMSSFQKKCHPYLCLTDSRKVKAGEKVYLLGGMASTGGAGTSPPTFGISQGVVSNAHAADPTGRFLPEFILTDATAFSPAQGMPLLNRFGKVIGLQVSAVPGFTQAIFGGTMPPPGQLGVGQGGVAAISEKFMRRGLAVAMTIDKCPLSKDEECLQKHLADVVDLIGGYKKYVKGYAGIAYELVNSLNFQDYLINVNTGARGALANTLGQLYEGPSDKCVQGVRVVTLSGDASIIYAEVPGTAPVVPYPAAGTSNSSFTTYILPEDQLVSFKTNYNCNKGSILGEGRYRIVPAMYTWEKLPGQSLAVNLRRPNQVAGVAQSDHLNVKECIVGVLQTFPPVMDYPWGLINDFPLISDGLFVPGPQLPLLQNPQLPSLRFRSAF